MAEKHSNCNRIVIKWIVAIFLVIVLCACLLVAVACNNHKHEYTSKVTKSPTCTESGVKTFTCECGDS